MKAATIISLRDIPSARILAASFAAHHDGERVAVLLLDDVGDTSDDTGEQFDLIRPRDLALDEREYHRLATIYDATALTEAVKPWLLQYLLDEGADAVIYLDPGIEVFDSLERIAGLAKQHGIVLTPSALKPVTADSQTPAEFNLLKSGIFNRGFIAVAPQARPFLKWYSERPKHEGEINPGEEPGNWLNLVPAYFDHLVLRDATVNVSFLTLAGHELTNSDNQYRVDGSPLCFFNFSGFSPKRPYLLSEHQGNHPRVLLSENPVISRLCSSYGEKLKQHGFAQYSKKTYCFDATADGLRIDDHIKRTCRRYFRLAISDPVAADLKMPDPFDTEEAPTFIEWLNTPAPRGPRNISRYLLTLYEERVDLRVAFPNLWGTDDQRFLDWAANGGDSRNAIPPELAPEAIISPEGIFPLKNSKLKPGVIIAGHMNTEIGLGEAARAMVAVMEASDIPYSIMPPFDVLGCYQQDTFAAEGFGRPEYDTLIACINPDLLPSFADSVGQQFLRDRYTIGYWAWEVEKFSDTMAASANLVDEIWVYGSFMRDAIAPAVDVPVHCCPIPITVPQPAELSKSDFGLPDSFMFLFSFAFTSMAERKNPWAVVEAFKQAFSHDEGPILVIKSVGGNNRVGDLERLQAATSRRDNIFIMDSFLPREKQYSLMNLCDAYISLHRGEGFGLTMAETMAMGKPVIATGYSGNLEFMDDENSFLVPYQLVTVPPGSDPYPEGSRWAEPDINAAADFMRLVYDNPAEARARGERARQDILQKHGPEARVEFVTRRLKEIRAIGKPERNHRTAAELAAAYLASGPDLGAPVRFGRLSRFIRKTVFRLLRNYDVHQRQTGQALLEAIRDVEARRGQVFTSIARLQADTDRRLQELERRLETLKEESGRNQYTDELAAPLPDSNEKPADPASG